MSTPVYGAHEAKTYYVVESTYGQTPATPSMTGLATATSIEPNLNPGLIKVRGTGSKDLQALRKGLRQVGLKIDYNLPSVAPIDFLLNIQTLDSLTIEVVYEKSAELIDLLYTGCRFNNLTVECSVEDVLKATVNVVGQNVAAGTEKISGASYSDHSGVVPYYESYVKQDTTTVDTVTDFRFSIENNLKRVPVIRTTNGHLLKYLPERHRNCTGELTFDFETKDQFDDIINDQEFDLDFGLGGSNKAVFSDCKWENVSSPTRIEDLVSVKALADRYRTVEATYVDQTGIGEYVTEDMTTIVSNTKGVVLTTQRKEEVLSHLRELMQTSKLSMPYDSQLIAEIHCEKYEIAKNGHITFSHPPGTHDDRLWALALACISTRKAETPAKLVRAW